jgi:glycosyltransferase involved in cell wall biosynthesis
MSGMDQHVSHRAVIEPLPKAAQRPLWSVMIPTHNCGSYLHATLASVLAQDPGADEMQIEVVDDASATDDPEAIVRALGKGRVGFFRQSENVGHTRNFETCLQRARGRLIHLLHGDDLVRDGFYRRIGEGFEARPDVGAAFCRYIAIDEQDAYVKSAPREMRRPGVIDDWLFRIGTGQRLQTPCMVVRRDVYEHLGGFDKRLRGAEDWEMWVRIAAHYPVWYEPEPLAVYRVHLRSKSQRALRTGANVVELRKAIDINRGHLPPELADRVTRIARQKCAMASLRRAYRLQKAGDREGALAQRRAARETSCSPVVAGAAVSWFLLGLAREGLKRARLSIRKTRGD